MKQRSTSGRINRSKGAALAAMALDGPRALANTLAAAIAAPTDVAAFRYVSLPRTITVNEGETPPMPGGYRRHGITRYSNDYLDGSIGQADLDAITKSWNVHLRSKVFGGGVRESSYDGSEYEQYISSSPGEKAGAAGGTYYGYESRGRYFSFGARSFNQMALEIDEGSGPVSLKPFVSWSQNNLQVMIDLQSYRPRKFTIRGGGDFWFAGFATEQSVTPIPYDFLSGKPTYAFIGDSYWQSQAFDLVGLNIGELFIKLVGGAAQTASVWGGTGYAASGGDGIPFDSETRLQQIITAKPDVVVVCGGINDGWPTYTATGKSTPDAIRTVYSRLRQELPAALLVFVTPFSPKESNWNNPDGVARQLRLGLIAEFERTPGPCIFLDGYLGGWRTSNGQTNLFDSGPWQTGDGWQGNPTGVGFGDTWTQGDATHLTPVGCVGLAQVMTRSFKAAISALLGNRQYGFELPLTYRTTQVGAALEFDALTDEKLAWRRNLLTETEFRNGLSDVAVMSGVAIASIPGYRNAIQFTAGSSTYAYKQLTAQFGVTYFLSVIVQMSDNSAPVFGNPNADGALNDFVLVVKGDATSPLQYVVQELGAGTFRVSCMYVSTATALGNFGVVKYATNSNRNFRVTAYQLERGPVLTNYQPLTDVATEFLAAFPTHPLYQDQTGMFPTFDREQPIGLILDTRKGGERGLELNTDVGFDRPAAWDTSSTATNAWVVSNGVASCATAHSGNRWVASKEAALVVGRWYEVYADIVVTAGGTLPDISGTPVFATKTGRWHWILKATTTTLQFIANGAFIGSIDNVTFKEVPGYHAIQAATGDRPVFSARHNWFINSQCDQMQGLGTTPPTVTNRVSLYGESVSSAVFTSGMTAGYAGTRFTGEGYTTAPIVNGVTYAWGYRIALSRALTGSESLYCYVTGGSGFQDFTINAANCAPFVGKFGLITASSVASANGAIFPVVFMSNPMTSPLTVSICKAQFAIGTQVGDYQAVNSATDYDARGFMRGARTNGINSWMSIPGFDMRATAAAVISATFKKDGDPTNSTDVVLAELGTLYTGGSGRFVLATSLGGSPTNGGFYVRGATGNVGVGAGALPVGVFTTMTGSVDWGAATPNRLLRVNGSFMGGSPLTGATEVGGTLAAGGNDTLYLFRRGGTGTAFNGLVSRMHIRATTSTALWTLSERWADQFAKKVPA